MSRICASGIVRLSRDSPKYPEAITTPSTKTRSQGIGPFQRVELGRTLPVIGATSRNQPPLASPYAVSSDGIKLTVNVPLTRITGAQ